MAELPLPEAVIQLSGTTVSRGHISYDYGNRVHWKITRDGEVVATPQARTAISYTPVDLPPGSYEIVLETWKHEGYKSGSQGKYIEISNKVAFRA